MERRLLGQHPGRLEGAFRQPLDRAGKVVKLGKLPVKIQLAGQYMPIHPDNVGQEWNIQLNLTPVIPKLIKEPLF